MSGKYNVTIQNCRFKGIGVDCNVTFKFWYTALGVVIVEIPNLLVNSCGDWGLGLSKNITSSELYNAWILDYGICCVCLHCENLKVLYIKVCGFRSSGNRQLCSTLCRVKFGENGPEDLYISIDSRFLPLRI